MVESRYTVKALDQSTWAAFAALVERNNGIFGGCWCMAFHPEQPCTDVQQERYAQKRAAKEQRVREGKTHAALVLRGRIASAGVSSAHPTRYPGSRPGRRTKRPDDLAGLANRVLLRR